MTTHMKWTDEEIRGWAIEYVSNRNNTLDELEKQLGVSHSTLWWCFVHRLHDKSLRGRVLKQLGWNSHKGGRRKCSEML